MIYLVMVTGRTGQVDWRQWSHGDQEGDGPFPGGSREKCCSASLLSPVFSTCSHTLRADVCKETHWAQCGEMGRGHRM